MKHFVLTTVITLLAALACSQAKAESVVYIYFDHKMGWAELPFAINGEQAFTLTPEPANVTPAMTIYKKVMRKITFTHPSRFVLSMDNSWYGKPYHMETILDLEDGETYFVELDFTMKGGTFKEVPAEKGMKYVQKALKDKGTTVNSDFVYEK